MMGDVEHCWTRLDFHQTTLPNLLDNVTDFRLANPQNMQIWRFCKKIPEKPGDWDLNLQISKICIN